MTLTRLGFFKLLAAVGVGQAAHKLRTKGVVWTGGEVGQARPTNEDAPTWAAVKICEKGEELCPQGHCQKPKRINGTTSSLTIYAADEGAALGQVELHVCSVCGIVYVPIALTVSKGGH